MRELSGAEGAADLDVIGFFDWTTEYDFLSNFYPSKVVLSEYDQWDDGKDINCPTVEHAFQAAKAKRLGQRLRIAKAVTPGEAKALGRSCDLRDDWVLDKVGIMRRLVRQKFSHPELGSKLLSTYPALLVEGNTWNDRFWGVCEGTGLNYLGHILMETRNEIIIKEGLFA
jgi:ribA/ribD-fused uncharacterized protein